MKTKRGDIEWDTLIPWIIVAVFLVIMLLVYLAISGKLNSAGEFLKNFFRFRR